MTAAGGASVLATVVDWAVSLVDALGAPGAGAAIALENVFPPLPSEVILPTAGLAASRGSFTLAEALVWTTLGSVVGAYVLYALGARLGTDRLRRWADRIPLMRGEDVDRTVSWFHRHGDAAVFFGRMLPVFRSLISIPAGTTRMPGWRFGLLTTAGSSIWNSIFVLAGYLLGESWQVVERYVGMLQVAVLGAVAVGVIWFVVRRLRSARRPAGTPDDLPSEPRC